ncbi:MAG: FimV/HubP family polar landmark protein [Methylobacter sp.]|nr:FimV/HubP family polar landmark protein [Methylobacter sp.]
MRNLTKTLAVVSLLAPASGHTLGIGEIKLHSALNQNLDAEIALTLSGESVSDIKVKLASPEKFDEAGVSWTYFLSKIKLETITLSNGSALIKLTSNEALKEPFLDFLLEVSWPKGNLYREFTVLVDPPSIYKQATIPVSTRTESYAQPSAATPQTQAHANGQSREGEYGPTLLHDTLWSVAERTRGQGDISVKQMMIAIYEANPHAFYKGNIYALTAGKMLKIPERGTVLKLSKNQALAEFNRQTKAWKNHSALAHADTEKAKPVLSGVDGSVDNQLTLAAPVKKAVADHAVIVSVNEQEGSDNNAADRSDTVKGNAEENVSAAVSADGALQSKVAELEKQLAMMQELIVLKDQQFAALQKQSQANLVAQQQIVPDEDTAAKLEDQITSVPQPTVVQSAEPVASPAQREPEASSSLDTYYLVVGSAGAAILTLLSWLWWRKRKVDEETNTESMFDSTNMIEISEADENISVPVVEDSLVVRDNDAGTVGESSFLSEFTPSDFDSFDTDQGEIDPISEADVYLAYGRYQQAEELIRQAIKDQPNRDECKLKLLEIFYANESNADFEAYATELAKFGKRNEAEFWEKVAEMGREICPASPLFSSGDDLFAMADDEVIENTGESIAGDNAPNIERVITGVVSFAKSDGDDFGKEATESKRNVVDFDLTSSDKAKDEVIVEARRNNEDVDFDLSSFSMDTKESNEAEKDAVDLSAQADAFSGEQVEDVNFDLSLLSMKSDEADKGVIASNAITGRSLGATGEDIDFDLSSFSIESDHGVIAPNTQAGKTSKAQIEDIDFGSFSTDANESDKADQNLIDSSALLSLPPETSVDNKQQEYETHEFDFSFDNAETKEVDSLDFSTLDNDDISSDNSLDFNDDMGGDFDFNFDLDLPSTTKDQESGQHEGFGVSALTDMDELETKLDLAKAYVDMGDADAAKDLAREVLEQGTVEQKKIAQALLDELG